MKEEVKINKYGQSLSFDWMENLCGKQETRPCSKEDFYAAIDDANISNACKIIVWLQEQRDKGHLTDEQYHERKSRVKKEALKKAFCFHAHFEPSQRKNENAIPTPFCIYDKDKNEGLEDSLTWMKIKKIILEKKGLEKYVVLMHQSASGKEGARIVFIKPQELTYLEAQCWLMEQMEDNAFDKNTKDAARASFAFPREYLYYIDEEQLFNPTLEPIQLAPEEITHYQEMAAELEGKKREKPAEKTQAIAPVSTKEAKPASASQTTYTADATFKGVPYKTILDFYWRIRGGLPAEGERNMEMHRLACSLRHITDDNEALMGAILRPYAEKIGIEREMTSLIHSACVGQRYAMSKGYKQEKDIAFPMHREADFDQQTPPKFPANELPQLVKLLISRTPDVYQPAVSVAIFPPLAAHLWRVYFRYTNNKLHEATLMHILVGESGVGKSCIDDPINYLMADIVERDEISRATRAAWNEKKSNASLFSEMEEKPHMPVQYILTDLSHAKLSEYGADAEDRFLYAYVNELELLDGLQGTSGKKIPYLIIKLAFDNARYGQERVSADAITAIFDLHFLFNASTTPSKARKYFRNVLTDGPVQRVIISGIEPQDLFAPEPEFGEYGEDFAAELKPYIDNLNQARGKIDCPEARDLALEIRAKIMARVELTCDKVYKQLSHRAVLIGYLMACVLYVANGCKWEKEIGTFIHWAVDNDLYYKMKLFGEAIRKESGWEDKNDTPAYKGLYNLFPAQFTLEEAMQIHKANQLSGDKTQVINLMAKWKDREKIDYILGDKGQVTGYKKIK